MHRPMPNNSYYIYTPVNVLKMTIGKININNKFHLCIPSADKLRKCIDCKQVLKMVTITMVITIITTGIH